jgi:hypothetical protein
MFYVYGQEIQVEILRAGANTARMPHY